MTISNRILVGAAMFALLLNSAPALAYVGPGAGLSARMCIFGQGLRAASL